MLLNITNNTQIMHTSEIILKNLLRSANVKKGEIYTHYKKPNLRYKVLNVALDEESEKSIVVYKALYGEKLTWTRKLDKWNEPIKQGNELISRFKKIGK